MRIALLLLIAVVATTVNLSAGLLPGQDAYVVRRAPVSLPNGVERSVSNTVIRRTTPGSYVPGIVVVKTRAAHGVAKSQSTIPGSTVNRSLEVLNVADVNSAYPRVNDGNLAREIGLDRVYLIRYTDAIDPFDACARLMDDPEVEYAIPMYTHKLFYAPNDTRYSQQPWMGSMKVDKAWDVTKGAATVIIAIIDSGTDWQHEDLSGNIWMNPKEIANNGIDDDSNGFIDDVRGWDFVGNISVADAQNGIVRPDNDPRVNGTITDNTAHGTVVGGCSGAVTNNAKGVASPGFNCKIIPIKCGSDNANFGGILQGYPAIAYAADLGAHIINCSWGGSGIDPGAQDVIDYATAKGSLVVAASGNDGLNNETYLQSPASLDGVFAVGSCSVSDRVSNFSNYGRNVDVYAPGENILSTYPNNQYRGLTGTSFSSPLTSGVAALVKAVHSDWTPEMIAAQIRGTVDPLIGVTIDTRPMYWGRVNAERAVKVNTSFTSGERMPGLMMKGLSIGGSGSGKITSYARTTVNFTIKNVLADAASVTVVPRLNDPRVKYFGTASISLGAIARNGEVSGSFDVQLDPSYPWYQSNIEVGLTMTSGSYINYEPVMIPVDLPTTNDFSALVQIPSSSWDQFDYTSDGTLFATGSLYGQRAILIGTQSGGGGYQATPFVATALEAVSTSTVFIGGSSSNVPTISRSTTSGSSWSGINVSASMASVEGIRMFDAQNGLAVGNPVGGKFGVVKTTNNGGTWTAVGTAPLSNGSERINRGAVYFRGDAVWFGTSTGRVISSLNKGTTWSQGTIGASGSVIVSVAFRDSSNGIVLYRTGIANDAPFRVASTSNGGANWKQGAANLALGITPVRVDAGNDHHLLIGSNGEVFGSDNNGADWQPVLSQAAGTVLMSKAIMLDRPSVFLSGEFISLLQYRYSGPNGSKLPEFTSSQVGFGTMEPGQSRNRTATIRNVGTSDVLVSQYEIIHEGSTPAPSFSITATPKTTIPAGGSVSVPMRCTASDTGLYTGKLRVTSDGTPSVIELPLFAQVSPSTSVQEDMAAIGPVNVWPNPASNDLSIRGYVPMQATLVSSNGTILYRGQLEPGTTSLDVRGLASGTYHLLLIHGLGVRTVPIVIAR
ncbi:MAG: S8 family serine peptidase [Ignavibacteria bacterium]|nr:S8 family serine peptidase [Ignavibacteria bacterium]MBK7577104.1 S8 family serine peptidase [Ignavibacteria bacterium]MBP7092672.1 S8 family serine peptidase [Candidatus Kapabacteria bacterium]